MQYPPVDPSDGPVNGGLRPRAPLPVQTVAVGARGAKGAVDTSCGRYERLNSCYRSSVAEFLRQSVQMRTYPKISPIGLAAAAMEGVIRCR